MGYTHYWKTNNLEELDAAEFKALAEDCITIATASYVELAGPMAEGPTEFTADRIAFNGVGRDEGHESFVISRDNVKSLDFCKTARKPYDEVVTACLIALAHRFPRFDVTSDGYFDEGQGGRALYERCFPRRDSSPSGIQLESEQ